MPMGCGCGIHDSGIRLHPGSDYFSAYGARSNADMWMAAYPFHLPSVRQGVDIQDAMLFRKPDGGLHGRPIPFDTLQVEIFLTHKGGQVLVLHRNAFLVDTVRLFSCTIVPGIPRLSVQPTTVGDRY